MVSRFGVPDRTVFFRGALEVRVVVVGLEALLEVELEEEEEVDAVEEDDGVVGFSGAEVDRVGVELACPSEESPHPASPAMPTRTRTDESRRVEITMPQTGLAQTT